MYLFIFLSQFKLWQHVDNWSKWLVSEERRVFQERIDNLADDESKFEIYTH